MIIVDSSVWIDYFNGQTTAQTLILDALLGQGSIALGDLILLEVLQGFHADADYQKARQLFRAFPIFTMVGESHAVRAAEYYRALRRKGITARKTVDVLIETFCIAQDHRLLFSDRDFNPFVDHFGLQAVT
ncbi:MAG: PIN domain nuclease [Bacteroidota bacterium]